MITKIFHLTELVLLVYLRVFEVDFFMTFMFMAQFMLGQFVQFV